VFAGPEDAPPATSERELLQLAANAVPAGDGYLWNQAIMELGALICTARVAKCGECPVRSACKTGGKTD
jgi:A/G-specific adenine glycosylase